VENAPWLPAQRHGVKEFIHNAAFGIASGGIEYYVAT
jgi:hypothetical protein